MQSTLRSRRSARSCARRTSAAGSCRCVRRQCLGRDRDMQLTQPVQNSRRQSAMLVLTHSAIAQQACLCRSPICPAGGAQRLPGCQAQVPGRLAHTSGCAACLRPSLQQLQGHLLLLPSSLNWCRLFLLAL